MAEARLREGEESALQLLVNAGVAAGASIAFPACVICRRAALIKVKTTPPVC